MPFINEFAKIEGEFLVRLIVKELCEQLTQAAVEVFGQR